MSNDFNLLDLMDSFEFSNEQEKNKNQNDNQKKSRDNSAQNKPNNKQYEHTKENQDIKQNNAQQIKAQEKSNNKTFQNRQETIDATTSYNGQNDKLSIAHKDNNNDRNNVNNTEQAGKAENSDNAKDIRIDAPTTSSTRPDNDLPSENNTMTAENTVIEQNSDQTQIAESDKNESILDGTEILKPLPDGYIKDNNIGSKIDVKSAARIINCSVEELIRVTELYNEYLTCSKDNEGHFLYNRYDISTILTILYDQVDGGYSDKDMLAYMKEDENYKRPFKDNAQEFPEQIRMAVNQAFKGYAYELQNSVRSLIGELGKAVTSMNTTIASQKTMLEEQSAAMENQTKLIMKMARQLESDAKAFEDVKAMPQIIENIPKTIAENNDKQSKAISDILQQMRSGQGETKKAISEIKAEIEKTKEQGNNTENSKKLESVSNALNRIIQEQEQETKKLTELSSAITSSEELKTQCSFLKEKLASAEKSLEESKSIEEYNTLSEDLDKANTVAKELQDKLDSTTSALEVSQAKEQAHSKELEDFKTRVGSAIKNMAEESDEKSKKIRQLENQLSELRNRQRPMQNAGEPNNRQNVPSSKAMPKEPVSKPMTNEQRRVIQKQYAKDARQKQTDVDASINQPNIPSWARSSEQFEEELKEETTRKKEKHGLFGKKKQKEPIIEDVELDDDADLTENTSKKEKKKGFGFLR